MSLARFGVIPRSGFPALFAYVRSTIRARFRGTPRPGVAGLCGLVGGRASLGRVLLWRVLSALSRFPFRVWEGCLVL